MSINPFVWFYLSHVLSQKACQRVQVKSIFNEKTVFLRKPFFHIGFSPCLNGISLGNEEGGEK